MAMLLSQCSTRLMLLLLLIGVSNAQFLTPDFYDTTCPLFETTVQSAVNTAVLSDPRMGASLLRLHFTDCFVRGCDASILLDDTADFIGEKTAVQNNNSLRGFEVIDDIKTQLETICPGVVSCADILTLAARESVVALDGPRWEIFLGRRDSTTASLDEANSRIPSPDLNTDALITAFSSWGFSAREMVALSGAHTIGQARCATFRNRIYNEDSIDEAFAATVRGNCPLSGGDDALSPLDVASPARFNNDYYANLISLKGLLHSDEQLFTSGPTNAQVNEYSTNSGLFFIDFAAAMARMSNLTFLTGTNGEIRSNCRRIN